MHAKPEGPALGRKIEPPVSVDKVYSKRMDGCFFRGQTVGALFLFFQFEVRLAHDHGINLRDRSITD
jgi:hypothetical protein